MNKRSTTSSLTTLLARPASLCGALLLVATLAIAQHALDANLRVGSGGYNTIRPQVTMSKPLYKVGAHGGMRYNAGVATGSPEVYTSAKYRRGGRPDMFDPPASLNRRHTSATALARPSYSASHSYTASHRTRAIAGPSTNIPTIPSRSRTSVQHRSSARSTSSLKRPGYTAGRSLNAMQAPSLNLSNQAYSATGGASSPVRSR
jgi:hypothetical protein